MVSFRSYCKDSNMSGRFTSDFTSLMEEAVVTSLSLSELNTLSRMDIIQHPQLITKQQERCTELQQEQEKKLQEKYNCLECQLEWICERPWHGPMRTFYRLPDDYKIQFIEAIRWYQQSKSGDEPYLIFMQQWFRLHPGDRRHAIQLQRELMLSDYAIELVRSLLSYQADLFYGLDEITIDTPWEFTP